MPGHIHLPLASSRTAPGDIHPKTIAHQTDNTHPIVPTGTNLYIIIVYGILQNTLSGMKTLVKYEKFLYLILLIGTIIYFPIFFNGFVWDDLVFIINNPQVHQLNISSLFGSSLFNSGPFYRPIPAVYFAILYSLAGSHAFLYHFVQLALHLADSILLFLFFCAFFSDGLAFFLALIFLVHPINVESVAYIASTTSELYFLPGIIALLLASKQLVSHKRFLWINGLLLLATFAKETGFLFFFLILAYRYLFKLGELKKFLLSGGAIVAIYAFFRIVIGKVNNNPINTIPIVNLPLTGRIANIPAIITYYLKIFIFPLNLAIWQQWTVTNLNFQNFYGQLIICLLLLAGLIILIRYVKNKMNEPIAVLKTQKKHQKQNSNILITNSVLKQLIFFSFWYGIGMVLILQIVPLDMTVSDSWFYFPLVGLLGILGVVLQITSPAIKKHHKVFLYTAIVIISLFSIRTFIRTLNYKNNLILYAHDLYSPDDNNNVILLDNYVKALTDAGKIDEAIPYAEKAVTLKQSPAALKAATDNLNMLNMLAPGKINPTLFPANSRWNIPAP